MKSFSVRKEKIIRERRPIMCHKDRSKTCTPQKMKMMPGNFCAVTEERCMKLKRWQKRQRRKLKYRTRPASAEPKTVIGRWSRGISS